MGWELGWGEGGRWGWGGGEGGRWGWGGVGVRVEGGVRVGVRVGVGVGGAGGVLLSVWSLSTR